MKSATLNILLIIFLLSCSTHQKEECVYDTYILEFSQADFESDIPPVNWGHLFFAEINNNSVIITNNFYLHEVYKKHYEKQFSSFHMFLCSSYKDEIIILKEYLDETMLRNSIVSKKESTFENMLLSELEERYFIDSDYLNGNKDLTDDDKFSLLYSFFKSQYYVFYSDYSDLYTISK